jgi:hypothetical protein
MARLADAQSYQRLLPFPRDTRRGIIRETLASIATLLLLTLAAAISRGSIRPEIVKATWNSSLVDVIARRERAPSYVFAYLSIRSSSASKERVLQPELSCSTGGMRRKSEICTSRPKSPKSPSARARRNSDHLIGE